jgi:hypothetical protein
VPLDATAGGALSDSYLTVAAADALAGADLGPEAVRWIAATTPEKEAALRRATRDLEAYLRTGWVRWYSGQALLFPRAIDVHTVAGEVVPMIPRTLELATYEQATYVLVNAPVMDRAATRRARELQTVSEPNTSYTRPQNDDPINHLSPAALHYLEGYRHVGTKRGVRSVRMASGFVS